MNDIKFIETLKQKRNACDYSQSRLAQELQISRQNLNEIENGKTKAGSTSCPITQIFHTNNNQGGLLISACPFFLPVIPDSYPIFPVR